MAEGADVGIGQVHYVDVIANGRAIRSGIIISEDGDFGRFFCSCTQDARDQMGFRIVVLAAFFGGAGGVEIAQRNELQGVGDVEGMQQAFHE